MKIRILYSYLWKLPLCGIAFFIGMALGGVLLTALGLQAPEMPVGTDANTVALWFLMGSIVLAFFLSFVARNLMLKGLERWLVLFALSWGVGAVGMVLESFFFMETGAVSSVESTIFTMLNFLLPSAFLSGVVVLFFYPDEMTHQGWLSLSARDWSWRLSLALLAYPMTYFIFGLLVEPLVTEYYTQGMYELTAPTWGQLIPLQLVRSALFLVVCLPVIRWWYGSSRRLWLALGSSFFVLKAFMAVITAYWFPWQIRLFHGLELLADAMIYTGILVSLFRLENKSQENNFKIRMKTLIMMALVFVLAGCVVHNNPTDQLFTSPEFSATFDMNADQETHGSFWVENTSDGVFPGDDAFEGELNLWNKDGNLRFKIEAPTIQEIQPGESIFLTSGYWHLDPGIYFLTWGSPKYGGSISVFSVVAESDQLHLGDSVSFRTKPIDYETLAARVGSVRTFSLDEDVSLFIAGETPLPDHSCVFPLLFDQDDIVDGFPVGQCAPAAEGRWELQVPAYPAGPPIDIQPNVSYRVILFSDDLTILPSEPFGIIISPPFGS